MDSALSGLQPKPNPRTSENRSSKLDIVWNITKFGIEQEGNFLGTVQKLFVQNAPDEFVSARRRREACRGTLTDDNAAMADSDKHNV